MPNYSSQITRRFEIDSEVLKKSFWFNNNDGMMYSKPSDLLLWLWAGISGTFRKRDLRG